MSDRQPVVLYLSLQSPEDIIEFPFIITARSQLTLKLIEFVPGARQSELVAAGREGRRLNVVQVFADPLKKLPAPVLAPIPVIPIAMIQVLVAPVVFFMPCSEISQSVHVIGQQVAVAARQSIIAHHPLPRRNDVVECLFIVAPR